MAEYVQVYTAVESGDDGTTLAKSIIDAKLGASVQIIGPIRTIARFDIGMEQAQEWQLIIKTTQDRYPALERHIREHHPTYENPEIVATRLIAGSSDYLRWVSEEVHSGDESHAG